MDTKPRQWTVSVKLGSIVGLAVYTGSWCFAAETYHPKLDKSQVCYYEGKEYSHGALIVSQGLVRQCLYSQTSQSELRWQEPGEEVMKKLQLYAPGGVR